MATQNGLGVPPMAPKRSVQGVAPQGDAGGRSGGGRPGANSRNSTPQSNIHRRLQALFPQPNRADSSRRTNPTSSARKDPRFLKVRIVTWNMHDSLPKGNLDELLGTIPRYVPIPPDAKDEFQIPGLSMTDGHPYHLVVVAGQECPTVSGIPLGLGGFRIIDKDKSKDSHTKTQDKRRSREGKEKDKEKDKVRVYKDAEQNISGNATSDPSESTNGLPSSIPTPPLQHAPSHHGHTSGWSWVLESWFCHGLGIKKDDAVTMNAVDGTNSTYLQAEPMGRTRASSIDEPPSHRESYRAESPLPPGKEVKRKKDKNLQLDQGPYELLAKERLMGIYLAVFIYKDLKPLVKGISQSAVTAGLLGGRWGNKGGVGISVNLDGTTLLFVNAHLAAHEGRVQHRLANMAKIKAELQVDAFLSQDDDRHLSEDLTDKFDYSFVFGDLNFRLDVTRLHADWLVAREEYISAIQFDQLYNLMKSGKEFVGFKEASIHFPPTFKYDVLKREKSSNSHLFKRDRRKRRSRRHALGLSEVEEKDHEDEGYEQMEDDSSDSDSSSSASSFSSFSRPSASIAYNDGDEYFNGEPSLSYVGYGGDDTDGPEPSTTDRAFVIRAALKAREKWRNILSRPSSSPTMPNSFIGRRSRSRKGSVVADHASPSEPLIRRSSSVLSRRPAFEMSKAASAIELDRASTPIDPLQPSRSRTNGSTKSVQERSKDETSCKGVYDSSSKQRVPSWCDRILYKSTVKPDPTPEEDKSTQQVKLGPRVKQFVSRALRPLALRGRSTSQISMRSSSLEPSPSPDVVAKGEFSPIVNRFTISRHGGSDQTAPSPTKQRRTTFPGSLTSPNTNTQQPPKLFQSRSIEPVITVPRAPVDSQVWTSSSTARNVSRPSRPRPMSTPVKLTYDNIQASPITTPVFVLTKPTISSDHTSSSSSQIIANAKAMTAPPRIALSVPWRLFGSSNRSNREPQPTTTVTDEPTSMTTQLPHLQDVLPSPVEAVPKKGDVVPLHYGTLDDQAMQRLSGRSDHRPVVGSYAIYV